jgi:hypothetical protein
MLKKATGYWNQRIEIAVQLISSGVRQVFDLVKCLDADVSATKW